ncbi:MAG: hypothetical protein A2Y07_00930 [Planctomycetes bacterium GWF2_50_10]|nr:MAG: hypothetical protein A2Y07_00930 [Planctomycetes bacterium GWF2_50_10]
MNIFEQAIGLKQEKEEYYRGLSKKCSSRGVRKLFSMLADEEAAHRKAIEDLAAKIPAHLAQSTVLADAKIAFKEIIAEGFGSVCDAKQPELYRKALAYEERAEKFYLQKAQESQEEYQKGIFKRIAEEETKHRAVLQSVLDIVQRPERWLENAEWYHVEDY